MTSKTEKLISLLEDAIVLLQSHGVNYWADWLSRGVECLKSDDAYGIEHLLNAYGGMGSFTDVFICPENGDNIQKNDVEKVNRQLNNLREDIYLLAGQIKDKG